MPLDFQLQFETDLPTLVKKAKAVMATKPKKSPEFKEAQKFLKGVMKDEAKKVKSLQQKRMAAEVDLSESDSDMETVDSEDSDSSDYAETLPVVPAGNKGPRTSKARGGSSTKRAKRADDAEDEECVFSESEVSQKKFLKPSAKTARKGKKVSDDTTNVYFYAIGDCSIPERARPGAAGFDLHSAGDYKLKPQDTEAIETGVKVILPPGCYGRIAGRSGLALEKKLLVGGGVVDNDFTGYIKVILFNFGKKTLKIRAGDRIAQLVVERYFTGEGEAVMSFSRETERGEEGFGSTGLAGAF